MPRCWRRSTCATKVRLLTGATAFTLCGEDSIGLAPMALSDGPTGVRGLKFTGGDTVALFPNATLLASAWSEDDAHEVGEMLAEEAERQQIHVVLGPTINLHRSPLGGRLFEAYSEDPLLTGRLAAAYVQGLQEQRRRRLPQAPRRQRVRDRAQRRWTPSSTRRRCARCTCCRSRSPSRSRTRGRSWPPTTTSTASPATEQEHVNNEVLKGEWGCDGLLMSDWFATQDRRARRATAGSTW